MRDCGLYYYGRRDRGSFPLDGVHVSARVVDLCAEVQLVMFFVNPESTPVDAEFVFPLDTRAAVSGFEVELETKLLIGQVKEKQEARTEYNAAIARGETAALLEKEKDDVFRQKIGNMPSMSRVNIRITYVTDLVYVDCADIFDLFLSKNSSAHKVSSPTVARVSFCQRTLLLDMCRRARCSCSNALGGRFVLSVVCRLSVDGGVAVADFTRNAQRPFSTQIVARRVWYGDFDYVQQYWPCTPWPWWRTVKAYNPERAQPCAFSASIEIECTHDIVGLDCPTHDVAWQYASDSSKKTAVVSLWNQTGARVGAYV